jgi:hypothetical protein
LWAKGIANTWILVTSGMSIEDHLSGKSEHTRELFAHFIREFKKIGGVTVEPAKTMVGIATSRKRVAYVTQFGRAFIHVVFPFEKAYDNNLCFQKIAQVPGDAKQFNHHFRMLSKQDINSEVKKFMELAYKQGS